MNINELKTKPIWQMTCEEFLYLHQNGEQNVTVNQSTTNPNKKYVYGILGIAQLFGCSNLVSAVLHLDEKSPHTHATIVPIVAG